MYLPKEWCRDEARREKAGVSASVSFKTKGTLAQIMLERALRTDLTVERVTGNSVYVSDRRLRLWLETRQQAFVLGIKSDEALWCKFQQRQAAQLVAEAALTDWQQLSAGTGSKGPREYDWLAITGDPAFDSQCADSGPPVVGLRLALVTVAASPPGAGPLFSL